MVATGCGGVGADFGLASARGRIAPSSATAWNATVEGDRIGGVVDRDRRGTAGSGIATTLTGGKKRRAM